MTKQQHELLLHTLGLDKRKSCNRNCYATGDTHEQYKNILDLVKSGLVVLTWGNASGNAGHSDTLCDVMKERLKIRDAAKTG